jgi:hypothetical protein
MDTCVYHRPTDLLPLPLLISAVFPVYKQNNAWLNFGSLATQFTPPQLKLLTFNLSFYPRTGPFVQDSPINVRYALKQGAGRWTSGYLRA